MQRDDVTSKKQLEIIQDVMPDVVIQQLLSLDPSFSEKNLAMMFALLSKIKIQTTHDHLVETNFKLAFHGGYIINTSRKPVDFTSLIEFYYSEGCENTFWSAASV